MAHIFQLRVQTSAERLINVLAETAEEAQSKAQAAGSITEGETIVESSDAGEVVA